MALVCPQCAAPMNEVTAEAKTGYLIMLDQCPRCGGIWCDRWELYPVTAAAAAQLDSVDQTALSQLATLDETQLECPRCRARMRRFHDPTVPADARIERCLNCDGMWLNRGELCRFKNHDAPATPPSTLVTDSDLDQLSARARSNPRPLPMVTNLDQAFEAAEPANDADDLRHELVKSAAWLVARVALRLLLPI